MKKKALIVSGGWDGHHPAETSKIVAEDLKKEGFEVEISTALDVLLDEARLKAFDLIVPNWTMGAMTGEQEKGLVQAVENGAGLGGFHGGMGDAFRNNTLYQFAVGGQFVAHPDNLKDYVVNIVKKADPIVAGLGDFTVNSEQYYMHVDPSNEVLATTTFQTKSAPWVNGTVMPVVWKRRYGKGRVFYQSIGHSPKEFDVPEVREITKRGLLWASR
ncbi:MAG: ThuA domain-containing protein [Methylacidiphilales bacterium]|nr:ThuA domain-containing protein [Candidatus Methylacidiphilales bacterium]